MKEDNPTKKIVVKADTGIVPQSPIQALTKALESGIEIEKLEKLLDLQAKYEAMEAKKAFIQAMADFKAVPIVITKDKDNKQYNSRYTSIGNLVNTVLPVMSKSGLSHKWDIEQTDQLIKITCIVTHLMGYSEYTTMSAPPDKSGSKNTIQQIKSTRTYLQGATFESAMGLASSDSNLDDDGNSAGLEFVTEEQAEKITTLIQTKGIDVNEVLRSMGCDTIDTIMQSQYKPLISRLKMPVVRK